MKVRHSIDDSVLLPKPPKMAAARRKMSVAAVTVAALVAIGGTAATASPHIAKCRHDACGLSGC